jgi:hypothetical protein
LRQNEAGNRFRKRKINHPAQFRRNSSFCPAKSACTAPPHPQAAAACCSNPGVRPSPGAATLNPSKLPGFRHNVGPGPRGCEKGGDSEVKSSKMHKPSGCFRIFQAKRPVKKFLRAAAALLTRRPVTQDFKK